MLLPDVSRYADGERVDGSAFTQTGIGPNQSRPTLG
jgi:hypothetical protein